MRIALWLILTTSLVVIINGAAYWWMPLGLVILLYTLDTIENMAHDSIKE